MFITVHRWFPPSSSGDPASPRHARTLRAVLEDGGTLALGWKSPVPGEGHGRVCAYLVERREQPAPNAPLTEWTQIAVALETSITLTRQPRAQQLEYRVAPVNNGGAGVPSNTASVVL
ncbi:MAG: fibronectin type III domain-containing protein [Candidatus Hydrogenedentes bacterium]|nr:fibronectin type III domain-containing protein [Candidatus Hydrogenedentota bacterium]